MVLPAQFELSLELTNIIKLTSQAVSTFGSLALVDAIKKAGSDCLTEVRMASFLGRHRVDPIIQVHFREKVAKSNQSVMSRYVDIILESGAGPTVQEALKNPALFSMVVQLSALSFSHQDEALAFAITEAMERMVREVGGQAGIVPEYMSLLGTIRACQQQTVAFRWLPLYEAIEYKLRRALRDRTIGTESIEGAVKATKIDQSGESIDNRVLPFSALQALLMWLHSLQSLPKNRFLHLRCKTGISTIVLWCHHILSIQLTVKLDDVEVRFGDDSSNNILVEATSNEESEAIVMDPLDQNHPLFTMRSDPTDSVPMVSENRVEAFGYGRKVLELARTCEDDIKYCSHWIIAQTLAIVSKCRANTYIEERLKAQFPSEDRILQAGEFFFGLEQMDTDVVKAYIGTEPVTKKFMKQPKCSALMAMVIIFARIHEQDLESCLTMPLSLSVFHSLRTNDATFRDFVDSQDDVTILDLSTSFRIFSQLLRGPVLDLDYTRSAVLISAWGWSVYFDCMDFKDPQDIPVTTFRVMCGVPTRGGLRRNRIIDGPNMGRPATLRRKLVNKDPQIFLSPGISTASRNAASIGHSSDAFQITLTFEWTSESLGRKKKYCIGFRDMQESCMAVHKLPTCQCGPNQTDIVDWIGALYELQGVQKFGLSAEDFFWEIKYPEEASKESSRSERIYSKYTQILTSRSPSHFETINAIWIFHVSDSPAARWLQLDEICKSYNGSFQKVLRGRDTCFECSTRLSNFGKEKPILLLI